MGASKNLYIEEELYKAEMSKETYQQIPRELQEQIEVKYVTVPNFPYGEHEEYVLQKKISDKEYKKLEKIKFEIRQKKTKN